MTGVFADNQPDFTWLKPYEEKTFTQYFMPYKGVGRVKNATRDALVNLEVSQGKGRVRLYTTGRYEDLALSNIGLKNYEKAAKGLDDILKMQADHQGALQHKRMLRRMRYFPA